MVKSMDMIPEQMGYDRAIVVFSPDGRLFQVEYAREAVKRGATAAGVLYNEGVVLAAKRKESTIVKPGEKIFQLDDHIGTVTSGLVADARVLVDMARVKAQQNRLIYGESISVSSLSKFIADRKQLYTQHAGVRPFGVSLLIGGVNKEPKLFETDPSGFLLDCKARALGKGADKINDFFGKHYKDNIDKKGALQLAVDGLKKEGKVGISNVIVSVIEKKKFAELNRDDLKKLGIRL
jgi:proteasome alpha subunit